MSYRRHRRLHFRTPSVQPDDVAGILWWFRPEELSALANNDPISTWADASGNGYDATASGSQRPTYKTGIINGLAAAQFNGSTNWMSIAAGTAGNVTDWSAVGVASGAATGAHCLTSAYNLPDHGWVFRINVNKVNSYGNNGGTGTNVNGGTSLSGWSVLGARTDSPSEQSVYLAGALDATLNPGRGLAYNSSNNTLGALIYGGGPTVAEQTNGYIAEIAVWDHAITEDELAAVSATLAAKYGLA